MTNKEDGNGVCKIVVQRLKIVGVDALLIFSVAATLALTAFAIINFFRLFHTGQCFVKVIASCPSLFAAAVWPSVVLVAIVIFRQQLLDALKEVPTFIKQYNANSKINAAVGGAGRSADEYNGGGSHPESNTNKSFSCMRFEELVLRRLQSEIGSTVQRRVNLFGSRSIRFDAVVVRGDRISAIELFANGWSEDVVRRLRTIERFHRDIGKPDQAHFDVILCLPIDLQFRVDEFAAQREYLSYDVEFRFYPRVQKGEG